MFTSVTSGTKWLSNTPDSASKLDGTEYNRIMTYVVLKRTDGAKFLYVNTHLHNGGTTEDEKIRGAQAEILLDLIQDIYAEYGNLPTIITGDFNTQGVANNTASYNAMLNGGFVDSSRVALEGEAKGTMLYKEALSGIIFDYIFVSSDLADDVQTYKVCDEQRNGKWASDHHAITSTIIFPTPT